MPRGAKPGNQNARKHGIYSQLAPLEIPSTYYPVKPSGDADYLWRSLEPEIYMIRCIMERLAVNLTVTTSPELVGNYLNLFSLCAQRLAVLMKTETLLNPSTKVNTELNDAIRLMTAERELNKSDNLPLSNERTP